MTLEVCNECYDRILRMGELPTEVYDDILLAYAEGELIVIPDSPHYTSDGLRFMVDYLEARGYLQTIDNELGETLIAPTFNKYGLACCKRHISVDLRESND